MRSKLTQIRQTVRARAALLAVLGGSSLAAAVAATGVIVG
jgi:hypothetical protein